MKLREHLDESPRGTGAAIAAAVGVHPVMVSQWSAGVKNVPAERASEIERATQGAVRRWDLRPDDWHRIWPELVGAEGAPQVQAEPLTDAA